MDKQQGTAEAQPIDFLWVNYTDKPKNAAKKSLKAVRQHVMHDFVRKSASGEHRKQEIQWIDSSRSQNADDTDSTTARSSSSPGESSSSSSASPESCQQLPLRPMTPQAAQQANTKRKVQHPSHHVPKAKAKVRTKAKVQSSPSQHLVDPFDVMPIKGSMTTDELIRWYWMLPGTDTMHSKVPWLRKLNGIWIRDLWDCGMVYEGFTHVLLRCGYRRRGLISGALDHPQLIFHSVQTARIAREQVAAHDSSDNMGMLIAALARGAIAQGDLEGAANHIKGLLVVCGATLPTFRSSHFRAATFTDLRIASMMLRPPILPYCPQDIQPRCVPEGMFPKAHRLATITLSLIPNAPKALHNLMLDLHLRSLAFVLADQIAEDPTFYHAVEHFEYRMMHRICRMVAAQDTTVFSAVRAISLSMLMVAWSTVPEHVPEYSLVVVCNESLMKRVNATALQELYEGLGAVGDVVGFWTRSMSFPHSLVWVLFVCWSITNFESYEEASAGGIVLPVFEAQDWFLDKLEEACKCMGINTKEELQGVLAIFPWTEHFCGTNCALVAQRLALR